MAPTPGVYLYPGSGLSALPSGLSAVEVGTETVAVSGGIVTCTLNGGSNYSFAYMDEKFRTQDNWTIEVVMRVTTSPIRWAMFLVEESGSSPDAWGDLSDPNDGTALRIAAANTDDLEVAYFNTSSARQGWNVGAEAWQSNYGTTLPNGMALDEWRRIIIQNDENGGTHRFRVLVQGVAYPYTDANNGDRLSVFSDWVNWTDTDPGETDDLMLVLGPGIANFGSFTGEAEFEYLKVCYGGDPIYASLDWNEDPSGNYYIYPVVAYGEGQAPVFTLPERDTSPLVPVGAASTWDDTQTRHGAGALGPDGNYYYVYVGGGTGGAVGDASIGIGLTNSDLSSLTKSADNPIVPGASGEPTWDTPFLGVMARLYWDQRTRRWLLLHGVYDSTADEFSLHYHVNPEDDPRTGSDWSYGGEIIDATGSTDYDGGVSSPQLFYHRGLYYLFVGLRRSTTGDETAWQLGLLTGPDLDNMSYHSTLLQNSEIGQVLSSAMTDSTTISVTSTTGWEAGMQFVVTDDATTGNWILGRIRAITNSTTMECEAPMTIGSGAVIVPFDDMRLDCQGVNFNPAQDPPWTAMLTKFGVGPDRYSGSFDAWGEWTGWASAQEPEGPWAHEWSWSYPAPPIGPITGIDQTGGARSFENIQYIQPILGYEPVETLLRQSPSPVRRVI